MEKAAGPPEKITIAYSTASNAILMYIAFAKGFLAEEGLDATPRNQVRLIDMKPDEMNAALDSGKVDAVSTFNPTVKQLEKGLGSRGIVFLGESVYTETFCVAAGQEYVKKHPGAIKKLLRALIKAETFVMEHDEDARRLVAEFIKIDKAALDEIWDIFRPKVALDQALLVNLEAQTRWVIKNKLTEGTSMPNYLDYIYVDGLQAIRPEAVRMVR